MGAPVTSRSSDMMVRLLGWKEDAKTDGERRIRAVGVEFGTVAIALCATVETVAYGILKLIATGEERVAQLNGRLSSSGFTIFWAVMTLLYTNLFGESYDVTEMHARVRMDSCLTPCRRDGDEAFVDAYVLKGVKRTRARCKWQRELERAIARYRTQYPHLIVNEDSSLFILEMLRNTNYDTKLAFEGVDARLFQYFFCKAIYEYTLGSHRHAPVPKIFQEGTQAAIAALREDAEYNVDRNSLKAFFAAEIQDGTLLEEAQEGGAEDALEGLEPGEVALRGSLAQCQDSVKKIVRATGAEFRGGQLLGPAWKRALKIFHGHSLN